MFLAIIHEEFHDDHNPCLRLPNASYSRLGDP
jgi:hypothetical protein